MRVLREILVCLLLVAAIAVLVRGMLFLEEAQTSLHASANRIDLLVVGVDSLLTGRYGVLNQAAAVLRESRKTVDVVQATSLAERAKVTQFSDVSIQAVRDLDLVARNGATAVESLQGAAAGLGGAVAALRDDGERGGRVIDAAGQLIRTLDSGSGQALDSLNTAVQDAGGLLTDARPTVDHVNSMTGHLDDGSNSLAQTLGFIRDDFSPKKKSFWVRLADSVTAGMFSIALHWLPQRVTEK